MKVVLESLIEGAKRAKGFVIVIDVFRAFTTDAYVLHNGAKKIIPVGTVQEAFTLKKENPKYILIGERNGIKLDGFDYGNSPAEVNKIDFLNKTVIQTTSSGTQGIVNAIHADEIILGNFVCLQAIVNYLKRKKPSLTTIVAMGARGLEKTDEDELCGQAIRDALLGNNNDFLKIKTHLRNYKSALKFFDISKPEFDENDFHLAMDFNKFDFILKVNKEGGNLFITKEI